MGGAEGLAGVDEDGPRAVGNAVPVMAAMNDETAGVDGGQGCL